MSIKEGDKEFSNNQEQDARLKLANLLEECKILAVTRPGINKTIVSRIPIAGIEKKIDILNKYDMRILKT